MEALGDVHAVHMLRVLAIYPARIQRMSHPLGRLIGSTVISVTRGVNCLLIPVKHLVLLTARM
jgi:hypothetical protein